MKTRRTRKGSRVASSMYLSDVVYASRYNSLLNPSNLHYVSALKGQVDGMLKNDFRYLDLGCGDGSTLNMLAALYPEAHFSGVDLNESHIELARQYASRACLDNVDYFRRDFLELRDMEFQDLDFITCFGTFSWISPDLQKSIAHFVGEALRPGGIFLVHYSASPGKVQIDPLWYLLRAVSEKVPGASSERARYGIGVIKTLAEKGADFFRQNPLAMNRVNTLDSQDLNYWAHEALTEWQALKHGDVSSKMKDVGLSFLGHANPELNHDELCVPGIFQAMLEDVENVETREVLFDYIVNKGIRSDVYIKRDKVEYGCSPAISNLPFGILSPDNTVNKLFKCSSGVSIQYDNPLYQSIISELKTGAKTPDQLAMVKGVAAFTKKDIDKAIPGLVVGRQVQPFAQPASDQTDSMTGKYKVANSIAKSILLSEIRMDRMVYIPYGRSGQCLPLKPLDALVLSAMLRNPAEGVIEWTVNYLNKSGMLLDSVHKRRVSQAKIRSMVVECHMQVRSNILPRIMHIGLFAEHG